MTGIVIVYCDNTRLSYLHFWAYGAHRVSVAVHRAPGRGGLDARMITALPNGLARKTREVVARWWVGGQARGF